jgi:uncharacterized repeat protein (TIGR01451 family)
MKANKLLKTLQRGVLSACILAYSGLSLAKGENAQVEGVLEQSRIVQIDGKEALQPADRVSPGDLLQYRVRYSNKGATAANNLVVTLPIPKGLEYTPSDSLPKAALASLDGQRFEAIPIKRWVKSADGQEVLKDVPLSQYRALRWQVDQLQAGKSVAFSARARVESVAEKLASK